MTRIVTGAALAALLFGLTACQQSTPPAATTPAPVAEFNQGDNAPSEPPPSNEMGSSSLGTIYFDYDRSNIREDARDVLRANAEALRTSNMSAVVEGHCDERGDEEYNLALGERRAHSVKKYLVNLGVPEPQLSTISYGEAKPAARGSGETAWQWNRRAEFRVR